MLDAIEKRKRAYITGLHLLQFRMSTVYEFPVAREHRKHTDTFDSRKRHIEQHERGRCMESDGSDGSPLANTWSAPHVPFVNTRAAENTAK